MARGLNKVMLIGNLGKDAETRYTPSGVAVTNFRLATARSLKDPQTGEWKNATDWHDVVVWRAEKIADYLTKGRQVYVEGRLQTRSWEDQNGQKRYQTEVVADSFGLMLLGGREGGGGDFSRGGGASAGSSAAASSKGGDDFGGQGVSDDDVPF